MNIRDKAFLVIGSEMEIGEYRVAMISIYDVLYDLESRVRHFRNNIGFHFSYEYNVIGYFNNEGVLERKFTLEEAERVLKLEKL